MIMMFMIMTVLVAMIVPAATSVAIATVVATATPAFTVVEQFCESRGTDQKVDDCFHRGHTT